MTRSLSIIVPAYNEKARLPDTLRRIEQYFSQTEWEFHEILVVDDGSTDGTLTELIGFANGNPTIRILRNPGNRGKGFSVRHGMLEARGEWRLFSDADLSTPIEEVEKLWRAIETRKADIAIGSRALDRSLIGIHQPGFRETAGKFFNVVMRAATGLRFADTQCGFKIFRAGVAREVFSRQTLERFGFDVEILFIARKLGYAAVEVPVRWNHADGSKVGMFTGLRAFEELAEIRFNDLKGRYGR
ncbi:MAG TPA: dolichyl-phosphate beta-glucosyltransferase [Bryobacteraceae bacterium]|nr:dolichyl-phosphate beta-glucosyltransferase [Bryobacteraceae bacterium]